MAVYMHGVTGWLEAFPLMKIKARYIHIPWCFCRIQGIEPTMAALMQFLVACGRFTKLKKLY
jgi:hypothetical protein